MAENGDRLILRAFFVERSQEPSEGYAFFGGVNTIQESEVGCGRL